MNWMWSFRGAGAGGGVFTPFDALGLLWNYINIKRCNTNPPPPQAPATPSASDPLGHRRRIEQHQRVVQLQFLRAGLFAPAGDVEHQAEQLPAHVFDRRLAGCDACRR